MILFFKKTNLVAKKIILISSIFYFSISLSYSQSNDIFYYESQARNGNPEMQFKMGKISEEQITEDSLYYSIYWYNLAIKGGSVKASVSLGLLYYKSKDYERSMRAFKLAIKSENPISFVYFGKNEKRKGLMSSAMLYFEKAMKKNNPLAFYEYGLIQGDYKNNTYNGYLYTKIAQIKGVKKAVIKSDQYKKSMTVDQIYSANIRIKKMIN